MDISSLFSGAFTCIRINMIKILVAMVIISYLAVNSDAKPVRDAQDAKMYLLNYGYLKQSDMAKGELSTEDDMVKALKQFQYMANIEESGKLDNDTIRMMTMPRCGMPDMVGTGSHDVRKKRFTLSQLKWPYTDLTYRIDGTTPDLPAALVNQIMAQALKAWSDVSSLTFAQVAANQPADILIDFFEAEHGDGNPFDGPGAVLAHAYFPNPNPIAGDAHFDDAETYTDGTPQGINLFQVAAHEFGHSLGLGHSTIDAALMAPFYQGYVPDFELHPDDVAGIQAHYGPNTNQGGGDGTDEGPPTPPASGDCISQFTATTQTADGGFYLINATHAFRIGPNGLENGYPKTIATEFPGLPDNIDAGLYFPDNSKTYFFKGGDFYQFSSQTMDDGYPQAIATAFPGLPDNLDSAFIWTGNGRVYFTKDDQYYRFSPGVGVDDGYPRPLSLWTNLPPTLDAAMQHANGFTYFFSGDFYYRFNDDEFKVDAGYPRVTSVGWLGCAAAIGSGNGTASPPDGGNSGVRLTSATFSSLLTLILIICSLCL
ncbi:matrix metalloproteinase-2-like [Lytechinus pictus]|uniref:matrix metalloproteinase-2-like n=1 Tax=Lytechinus pictus TaxID=7653 RepID=UPI0030BA06AC